MRRTRSFANPSHLTSSSLDCKFTLLNGWNFQIRETFNPPKEHLPVEVVQTFWHTVDVSSESHTGVISVLKASSQLPTGKNTRVEINGSLVKAS